MRVIVRCKKKNGLQACIEMGLTFEFFCSNGCVVDIPKSVFSEELEKTYRKRVKQLDYDYTIRWSTKQWMAQPKKCQPSLLLKQKE